MTDDTVSTPEDPRKPQGSWPVIVFVLGLIAVGLVNCSAPFHPVTGVETLPAARVKTPAGTASSAQIAPPPAKGVAAAPAKTPPVAPNDISEQAKKILADLGQKPSAKACETGFARLVRREPFGFRRNMAELGDKAQASLKGVAAIAAICGVYKIEVAGHTDRSGSRAFNQKLSEDRAAAVKEYLVAQGAPATALTSKGYGESRPLKGYKASKSRRISFTVSE